MLPAELLYDFDELAGLVELELLLPRSAPPYPFEVGTLELPPEDEVGFTFIGAGLEMGLGSKKDRC